MRIEKGDLVTFKPEYNGDDWAEKIALVVKFNIPVLYSKKGASPSTGDFVLIWNEDSISIKVFGGSNLFS